MRKKGEKRERREKREKKVSYAKRGSAFTVCVYTSLLSSLCLSSVSAAKERRERERG
jgi:hypothetical protein